MIHEIRYKGQIINQEDIEVTWSDHFGDKITSDIEDFGMYKYREGYAECKAGESW